MLLVKRRHLDHRCRRDTTRGGLEGAYTYTQNVAERRMDYRRYCLRRTCWFPPQTGGTCENKNICQLRYSRVIKQKCREYIPGG